jgi:hypothetical protein
LGNLGNADAADRDGTSQELPFAVWAWLPEDGTRMIQLPVQLAAQGCRDMGLGVSGRDAQVPPPGLQAVEHVFCRSCQPLQSNARLRLLLWSTNRRLLFHQYLLLSESYLGSRRDVSQGHAHHATCHVADLMQELVRSAIARCWNCGVSLVLRLARVFSGYVASD